MSGIHPEYVVDDKNRRKAVLLPLSQWKRVMEELEELEDIRAYDKAKLRPSAPIKFDDAVREIEAPEQG